MWRTLYPFVTLVVPVVFGMGLLYLYIGGSIGMTTLLVSAFALAAVAVTAVMMDGDEDDERDTEGIQSPRARR